jgi:hypothetical protein
MVRDENQLASGFFIYDLPYQPEVVKKFLYKSLFLLRAMK